MSTQDPRHRHHVPRHRALKAVAISVAAVLVVVLTGGFLVYRHLEGNITSMDVQDALGTDRPTEVIKQDVEHKPLNILLLGSDTRDGQGNNIGGETPGLSDTTILLHISADRDRAYGVSIPRDSMVERPECERKDGQGTDPGGLSMFNAAYAVGGPACTIKTVESLTEIRINHFVVVDFNGFKNMVDALDGVPVCVPEEVNDNIGHIYLPAGSYEVKGQQALSYVRLRHGLSENGDIGRMKRQQAFLAAMANKAISAGTLLNPVRLYNFLDAATKSLTTDPELASLNKLRGLAGQLKGIGLDKIQFLTVPWETYPPDHNRVQWAPESAQVWKKLRLDEPLPNKFSKNVTTAAEEPGQPTPGPSESPSTSPTGPSGSASPSPGDAESQAEAAARAQAAAENGLCA
jgi:LCP family protein required for cell wall assembly